MDDVEQHDPGGKSLFPMPHGVEGEALMSPDGLCRFLLYRKRSNTSGPRYLWIGLNPSAATPKMDDPTIRVEWNLTEKAEGGGAEMVWAKDTSSQTEPTFPLYTKMNVLPFRVTNPDNLGALMLGSAYEDKAERDEHVGRMQALAAGNMVAVIEEATKSDRVIVAWGRPRNQMVAWQCMQLLSMLRESYTGVLWCVGTLAENWPAHPLRRKCLLQPYRVEPTMNGKNMRQVMLANIKFMAGHVREVL